MVSTRMFSSLSDDAFTGFPRPAKISSASLITKRPMAAPTMRSTRRNPMSKIVRPERMTASQIVDKAEICPRHARIFSR
jgi:hypothetical protein